MSKIKTNVRLTYRQKRALPKGSSVTKVGSYFYATVRGNKEVRYVWCPDAFKWLMDSIDD